MLGHQRGKESPMNLDTPSSHWAGSLALHAAAAPPATKSSAPSSPATVHPAEAPVAARAPIQDALPSASSPNRQRASPLCVTTTTTTTHLPTIRRAFFTPPHGIRGSSPHAPSSGAVHGSATSSNYSYGGSTRSSPLSRRAFCSAAAPAAAREQRRGAGNDDGSEDAINSSDIDSSPPTAGSRRRLRPSAERRASARTLAKKFASIGGGSSVPGTPSATAAGGLHHMLPVLIMGYLQMAFNAVIIGALLYVCLQFFLTVRHDVAVKVEEHLSHIMGEIAQCSKEYAANRCTPDLRVPAMERSCVAWEKCMQRDPSVIGRAKLSAETFAEIINGFIEPISYKTMVFILMALFGTVFLSNYAFTMARSRVATGRRLFSPWPSASPQAAPMYSPLVSHAIHSSPDSPRYTVCTARCRGRNLQGCRSSPLPDAQASLTLPSHLTQTPTSRQQMIAASIHQ